MDANVAERSDTCFALRSFGPAALLRGGCLSRFCVSLLLSVAFVESVNASSRVHQLLFAGKERVTRRADFHMQLVFARRVRRKRLAAGALHFDFVIFGMDSLLHLPFASFWSIDDYLRLI
jgi:hypothetical protein